MPPGGGGGRGGGGGGGGGGWEGQPGVEQIEMRVREVEMRCASREMHLGNLLQQIQMKSLAEQEALRPMPVDTWW